MRFKSIRIGDRIEEWEWVERQKKVQILEVKPAFKSQRDKAETENKTKKKQSEM